MTLQWHRSITPSICSPLHPEQKMCLNDPLTFPNSIRLRTRSHTHVQTGKAVSRTQLSLYSRNVIQNWLGEFTHSHRLQYQTHHFFLAHSHKLGNPSKNLTKNKGYSAKWAWTPCFTPPLENKRKLKLQPLLSLELQHFKH